jgi:pyruvate dehydrogenase E2 component (dihydrolipoamide acetyltransferase)
MGQIQEVRLPDIGGTQGVAVVEILVEPGQVVEVDDSLLTLESDKASMEVPSPYAGKVVEIRVRVGDGVEENGVLATIEVDTVSPPLDPPKGTAAAREEPEAAAPAEKPASAAAPSPPAPAPPPPAGVEALDEKIDEASFKTAHAGPAVRRYARELGVDLQRVKGSGRKGRILEDDVRAYVKAALRRRAPTPAAGGLALPAMPEIDFSKFGPVEEVDLHRIRVRAAENLHRSWLHVPHVTQHEEADVTEMEEFRKASSEEAKRRGFKLTPVAFLLKAAAATLKEFPDVNSSLHPDGEKLIHKRYYHLGVAVDTQSGLVVPVIRDVDQKGLFELAEELGTTSREARDGKLPPQSYQGATFTITSLGGIGGTAFTPIVNAPEVAILGVSRTQTRAVLRDGAFVPRLMLPLSLSYDHRVVDGAMACRFTVHLAGLLSDIRRLLF